MNRATTLTEDRVVILAEWVAEMKENARILSEVEAMNLRMIQADHLNEGARESAETCARFAAIQEKRIAILESL